MSLIRVSGPKALCLSSKIAPFLPSAPESHRSYLGFLSHKGEDLDQSLVTYFAEGRSFTGEETVEISCHGGQVWRDILKALLDHGARVAERGEFSFRAFANGKLDLAQAEGLLQLIESSSRQARRQALSQLKGELSLRLKKLEEGLLSFLSQTEAEIDFSHEELDLPSLKERQELLKQLKGELLDLLSRYRPFEKLEEGLSFGIFGRANSGKSSLFNALLAEDRALVSEEKGTTRDIVEGRILNSEGLNALLKDSAGFQPETKSQAELLGQKRARGLLQSCDYKILLIDASLELRFMEGFFEKPERSLLVFSKKDLFCGRSLKDMILALRKKRPDIALPPPENIFFVSSVTGEGVSALREKILSFGKAESEDFLIANFRHYSALKSAKEALDACFDILEKRGGERDLIALELRQALSALQEISGRNLQEHVLDQIFQSFCIGK